MVTNLAKNEEATGGTEVTNLAFNAFESYGNSVSNRNIVGKLLKFSKGDWLAGEDAEEVDPGKQLVVHMDSLAIGWIKWEDNKPSQQVMGLLVEGHKPQSRKDLGDLEEDEWEVDEQSGQPRDPWQFSNYLIMKEVGAVGDEENLYTFATSSKGGLGALGELCKTYGKAMRTRPDEWPIVTLGVGSYNHPNKAFGRIKFPTLEVTGWEKKSVGVEKPAKKTPAKKK